MEEVAVYRLIVLTIVAAAVVLGVHSGNVTLILAAVCGACGVAALADARMANDADVKPGKAHSAVARRPLARHPGAHAQRRGGAPQRAALVRLRKRRHTTPTHPM